MDIDEETSSEYRDPKELHFLMGTPEDINTVNAEDRKESYEQNQLKNTILGMNDPVAKQKLWSRHFPPIPPPDDSYLLGEVY